MAHLLDDDFDDLHLPDFWDMRDAIKEQRALMNTHPNEYSDAYHDAVCELCAQRLMGTLVLQ